MPGGDRLTLYVAFALLWVTGIGWLILDLWFTVPGEFGVTPHVWAAPLLLAHGVLAVPALVLIGWIAARHATPQWKAPLRRRSGGLFAAVLLLLSVSGFGLFFLASDSGQRVTAVAHEWIGVLFTLFLLEHWFFGRRR
jgi:hypothetical protein